LQERITALRIERKIEPFGDLDDTRRATLVYIA
jgi:hypothetical protein